MMATLACYEGLFGSYHPQTLALAVALCSADRREGGQRLLHRAIGDLTKHHGPSHPVPIRALEAWSTLVLREPDWGLMN
jgi:hypothetical protein